MDNRLCRSQTFPQQNKNLALSVLITIKPLPTLQLLFLFLNLTNAKKLYDFRLPLYLNYADEIIDIDFQSTDEIALEIIHREKSSDGF